MSSIYDYFDKLEEERDDRIKKFHREKYSILLLAGSLDMNLGRKYLFRTLFLAFFNYAVLANQDSLMFYSSFLLRDDFETGSGVMNYALLLGVSIGILANFQYYRRDFLLCSRIMSRGLFHYRDKLLETEDMIEFRKQMKFQRNMMIALSIYVLSIGVVAIGGPFIDELTGHGFEGTYTHRGVNVRLPVPLYYPFETSYGIGLVIALALTLQGSLITCAVLGGASFIFSTLSQFILTELKTLTCSVRTISFRARKLYCRIHEVNKKSLDPNKIFYDPEFQNCITECLKENIQHHIEIKKFAEVFERITRIPVMLCFIIVTLAIALSMIKINEGVVKVGTSIAFAAVALAELFNMLNVAVCGEFLITVSQEVNWEIYFTPWYKFNLKNKKLIRQFLLSTQKQLSLSAWIVRMDMEMFASVMNSAYSFFNFLKLSKTHNADSL